MQVAPAIANRHVEGRAADPNAWPNDEIVVDICVCTYQRSRQLRRLLESLAAQQAAPKFRVLVADNHPAPVETAYVARLARQLDMQIDYIHAPARNIAVARNACIEHARAPLLAFIDDDEIADPDWLAVLHDALQSLDVVFGPVRAQYQSDAPEWIVRGDFHTKIPSLRPDGSCDTGYTANVLMRRACIGARRFHPALGRSGGEDTLFFAMLKRDGARLGFCRSAQICEPVEGERLRFLWLCKRSYCSGQAHARVLRFKQYRRLGVLPGATLKMFYCALAMVCSVWSPLRWRRHLLRGSLHFGVIATMLGAADLELYGNDNELCADETE